MNRIKLEYKSIFATNIFQIFIRYAIFEKKLCFVRLHLVDRKTVNSNIQNIIFIYEASKLSSKLHLLFFVILQHTLEYEKVTFIN